MPAQEYATRWGILARRHRPRPRHRADLRLLLPLPRQAQGRALGGDSGFHSSVLHAMVGQGQGCRGRPLVVPPAPLPLQSLAQRG